MRISLQTVLLATLLIPLGRAVAAEPQPDAKPGAKPTPGGKASADGKQPKRAIGATYTVPIPRGFVQTETTEDDMVKHSGGVVLQQAKPAVAGGLRARFVVSPLLRLQPGFDATKPATCQQTANDTAKAIDATVKEQGIVGAPFGPTCQWTSHDNKEANRAATATLVYSKNQNWLVTCTYDLRDTGALKACKELVSGWVFKP